MLTHKFKKFFNFSFFLFLPLISSCGEIGASNVQTVNLFTFNSAANQQSFPVLAYLQTSEQQSNGYFQMPNYTAKNAYVYRFLAARTIVLQTKGEKQTTLGTGTILAKVSTNPADYHYYVGTNLHVARAFMNNNHVASFSVSPYLTNSLNVPSNNDFFALNDEAAAINAPNEFLSFKNSSKKSVFWTATNIKVNNYITENAPTDQNQHFNNWSFRNKFSQQANFSADFAVLSLDFANLLEIPLSQNSDDPLYQMLNTPLWKHYRLLFDQEVAHRDVQFDHIQSAVGYIAGFPSSLKQPKRSGFINLKIESPMKNVSLYHKGTLDYNETIENQGLNTAPFKQVDYYYTPTSHYTIPQMNLQAGASGSIFIHADDKKQQVSLNGIYWGIFTNGDQHSLIHSTGQIAPFTDHENFDLIGGAQKPVNTPDQNSLCQAIDSAVQQNSAHYLPAFCK